MLRLYETENNVWYNIEYQIDFQRLISNQNQVPDGVEKMYFDNRDQQTKLKINDLKAFLKYSAKNGFELEVIEYIPVMNIKYRGSHAIVTFKYCIKCVDAIKKSCKKPFFDFEKKEWKININDVEALRKETKAQFIDIVFEQDVEFNGEDKASEFNDNESQSKEAENLILNNKKKVNRKLIFDENYENEQLITPKKIKSKFDNTVLQSKPKKAKTIKRAFDKENNQTITDISNDVSKTKRFRLQPLSDDPGKEYKKTPHKKFSNQNENSFSQSSISSQE